MVYTAHIHKVMLVHAMPSCLERTFTLFLSKVPSSLQKFSIQNILLYTKYIKYYNVLLCIIRYYIYYIDKLVLRIEMNYS